MEDAERPFGRFALKDDDEIAFAIPGEEGEFRGVVSEIVEDDEGEPALSVYLPGFPRGIYVTVYPEEITAKILYSNAGLYRFEIADKVEYWDEELRRVHEGWVYDIDSAHREIVVMARGRKFARFPEELRIVSPPRLYERREVNREEEKR